MTGEHDVAPVIRRAGPADAGTLTAIAHAAKRHWDYPADWMAGWDSTLTLRTDDLERLDVFVIEVGGRVTGFSATRPGAPRWALEHLWVAPDAMGRGLGRRLVAHALARATAAGAVGLDIESDPNAEGFYARLGARRIGWTAAPVPGEADRCLPHLVLDHPRS
jgi:GNAT superfamily N-acetyltransferase